MLDLSEIIAEAEAAPRETADVEVIFNTGISKEFEALRTRQQELLEQIEQIEADLAGNLEQLSRDQRAGDSRPSALRKQAASETAATQKQLDELAAQLEAVEARAAQYLVTFRLTALHGFEWDDITSRSAPREGNAEDASQNYNVDEVTRTVAARSAVRVGEDGELIDVTSQQWDGIWKTLPSLGRRQLRQAVWILNEYATITARNEAVVAARKASTGRPGVTPTSPSASASTRGASTGGSPASSRTTSTTSAAA